MKGCRGGSGETSGCGVAWVPMNGGSPAAAGPSGMGAAVAGAAARAAVASVARSATGRMAALYPGCAPVSGDSRIEAQTEPVERAQPDPAAAFGGVGGREPVAREPD